MNHTMLLNAIAQTFGYKSYLEIGSQYPPNNFDHIAVPSKVAVDPAPQGYATFVGTSDDYFASIDPAVRFDLVFIDGLHHCEQVIRDVYNSLKHLTPNGTIVCHDCLPSTEFMQQREDNHTGWTGDVWKAIVYLRDHEEHLSIRVVDTDMGCGIIRHGHNRLLSEHWCGELTYDYYDKHKKELMNVISIEEFVKWLEEQK